MKYFTCRFFCTFLICLISLSATLAQGTLGKLTRIDTDRKIREEDLKPKEISSELAIPKNAVIYIENNSRNIEVKIWEQPKIKISTLVYYAGDGKLTDEEWLDNAGISLKTLGNSIKVKVNNSYISEYYPYGSTTAVVNDSGKSSVRKRKNVIVFVPAGTKLNIDGKYSEISLPANLGDVTIAISNSNLDAENLGRLHLNSKYSVTNLSDVKNAEIEIMNGRLNARNMDELDLDTKNSTIELANSKKALIRSTNDQIEFEEVGELSGRKNYGNLRIEKLSKSIDLEGANSDIKIRNVAPTVSLIKIDDKYADIRIPLKALKNYSISYTGAYSAVYGNFEKKILNASSNEAVAYGGIVSSIPGSAITAPSYAGTIQPNGTITGGTFSGTLYTSAIGTGNLSPVISATNIPPSDNVITVSGIKLEKETNAPQNVQVVQGYEINQPVTVTNTGTITVTGQIVAKTISTVVSTGKNNSVTLSAISPNISSLATLTALTVTGIETPVAYKQPSITSVGTLKAGTVSGVIAGGTFLPNGKNESYIMDNGRNYYVDNDTPAKFTASVGDGNGLVIQLKCQNCTVDFK